MITLITGTPGSGKTLRCVELLAELRNSDDAKTRSRLIFANVNGLAPEIGAVAEFDPLKWMDLPEGSLIVIDECQDFWPSRPSGSRRPESVAALNTHRHKGIDFVLLTQHPGLIDQDIRALVGRHLHAYRPRAQEHSVWYEWSYCEAACQPKLKPIPEKRKFNKQIFSLYKSTVENTHKPQSWWPIIKKNSATSGCHRRRHGDDDRLVLRNGRQKCPRTRGCPGGGGAGDRTAALPGGLRRGANADLSGTHRAGAAGAGIPRLAAIRGENRSTALSGGRRRALPGFADLGGCSALERGGGGISW